MILDRTAAARLRPRLLSFHDLVERALFDPRWGYYATGAVRFGDGGHFDTYPIALSPYFGRMVAARAHRVWKDLGRPRRFEICEVGAGNGQLCLDVLATVALRSGARGDWADFDRAFSYRIVEKSPALRRRQAALLGTMATRVCWDTIDLSRARRVSARGAHGLVIANEVLDCLAHHKVVLGRDGIFRVVHVGALGPSGATLLTRDGLFRGLERGERLRFREFLLPVESVRGLGAFLERHYADVGCRLERTERPWTYYACPATEVFVTNVGALYDAAEILLIDYGGDRHYHLHTPAAARVSAGRPEDRRATPYRSPGRDDITFLVDFSVAMTAARAAGLTIRAFGPQGELARLSGVRLGVTAEQTIIRHRALGWLLALTGVGPETQQRAGALSWGRPRTGEPRKTVAQEARQAVEEFLGRRANAFHLLALRKRPTRP